MKSLFRLTLFLAALAGTVTACAPEPVFLATVEPGHTGWAREERLDFTYENRDTLGKKDLVLIVRHAEDYPYDRLDLELTAVRPDGRFWTDTLFLPLKEGDGWKGKRLVSVVNREEVVREGFRFGQTGPYRFRMRHLMPDARLKGVKLVGVSIR